MDKILTTRSGIHVGWPCLNHKGTPLYPVETYLDDGRIHISFHDEASIMRPVYDPMAPRVGLNYAAKGQVGVRITGLLIPVKERQDGLAGNILRWLRTGLVQRNVNLVGTGRIHKPLIALLLQRQGFRPVQKASVAEILNAPNEGVPQIRWLHHERDTRNTVGGSPTYGAFYTLVGSPEVGGYREPTDPSMVVALHTQFLPPGIEG